MECEQQLKLRELRTLIQWLKEGDIHAIDVQEPGMSVRIVMVRRAEAAGGFRAEEYAAPPAVSKRMLSKVTSNAAGIFLSVHPLRSSPLAVAGRLVKAGDVLGLLKVADVLYRPVLAGRNGCLVRVLAVEGDSVEEGMPLFELDIGGSGDLTSLEK